MSSRPPLSTPGPGDPVPLDRTTWGAVVGAARQATGRVAQSAAPEYHTPLSQTPQLTVYVRNDTAQVVPSFGVLRLAGSLLPPTRVPHSARQTPVFSGVTPETYQDAFAVLLEPAAPGRVARAAVLGTVPCQVRIADAGDQWAAPNADDGLGGGGTAGLVSRADGGPAKIIWRSAEAGLAMCHVLLQGDMGAGEFAPVVRRGGSGSGPAGGCEPDDDGYLAVCVVDGGDSDDVLAVRDTQCLDGVLYVTRGRLQIVQADGRLRNDWYDLATTEEGCCACGGSGGSGGGGSGANIGPCPPANPVNVVVTGPWGPGEAVVELPVALTPGGGSYRTTGPVSSGGATLVAGQLTWRLVGDRWLWSSVVETAAGVLVSVSSTLAVAGTDGTLEGTALGGAATVSADDPCYTAPPPLVDACGCDVQVPAAVVATVTTSAGSGTVNVAWNGTAYTGAGTVCTTPVTVTVTPCYSPPAESWLVQVEPGGYSLTALPTCSPFAWDAGGALGGDGSLVCAGATPGLGFTVTLAGG